MVHKYLLEMLLDDSAFKSITNKMANLDADDKQSILTKIDRNVVELELLKITHKGISIKKSGSCDSFVLIKFF